MTTGCISASFSTCSPAKSSVIEYPAMPVQIWSPAHSEPLSVNAAILGKLWLNQWLWTARDFSSRQGLKNEGILYVPAKGMPASVWLLCRQRLRHISRFSNRRIGRKDPSSAVGDLFRGSLVVWLFTVTAASSTHRPRLQRCCKNAVWSSPFPPQHDRMTMPLPKHSSLPSKKKRRTAESTPQNRATANVWSNISNFTTNYARIEP